MDTLTAPLVDIDYLASLIERLTAKQAKLPDYGDLKSDNERAQYYATRTELSSTITGLMNPGFTKLTGQLADLESRRNAVAAKRQELDDALAAIPEVAEITSRDDQEHFDGRKQLLRTVWLLDRGLLFRAPGETYDSLEYLDGRIAEVQARLDQRRAMLAGCIETAERLLAS